MDVFEFNDYRTYISHVIETRSKTRGYQSLLAEAAGCQNTYFSNVMRGRAQLTPDHAAALADFWGMNADETRYFLDLVHLDRAATVKLKNHIQESLEKMQEKWRNLSERLRRPEEIEIQNQSLYYSQWFWSAIHVLVSIPDYQTAEAIARRLDMRPQVVKDILAELETMQLIVKGQKGYSIGKASVHVSKSSPFNYLNHMNWRNRALVDIAARNEISVHYTSVCTLSKQDFQSIREMFFDLIQRTRQIVAASPEEDCACITLDFFQV